MAEEQAEKKLTQEEMMEQGLKQIEMLYGKASPE